MRFGLISIILAAALMAFGVAFPWSKTVAIIGLCYGLAALGVSLPARAGQVSFGHAMFACVAAYAVAFIGRAYPGLDGLVLVLLGTLISASFGGLIGLFMVRYRGIFFGMLNLAVSMVIFALLGKLYNLTGGTDGIRVDRPFFFGFETDRGNFETLLLAFALFVSIAGGWFTQRFIKSGYGEALLGLKTNETRLEYLGLSAQHILWVSYVISATLLGLSGAIFALAQGLVTPDMGSWTRSGEFVFITILGGVNHALGAFLGAAVFEIVKLTASAYMAGVWQLILGVTLLIVIVVAPDGIVGALEKRSQNKQKGTNQ
jgi:ABC-type branched-subunit amino acid transport system permease subunit